MFCYTGLYGIPLRTYIHQNFNIGLDGETGSLQMYSVKMTLRMGFEWALINWCPYEKATQHKNKIVTYRKDLRKRSRNWGDAVTISGTPGPPRNGRAKKDSLLEPCSMTFTGKMFTTVYSLQKGQ